ncbi:MAG: DNA polymerase III subunit beta [Ignavibacteriales bacterium]
MRISLDQSNLAAGIQAVSRAVSARSTMPVLSGILISAAEGKILFRAYDTEIGIETPVDGKVERDGAIVLPARIMGEIVRSIPHGEIVIDANQPNFTATLTWGRSEFTIHGLDPGQFPTIPEAQGGESIGIDVETFRGLIKQTTFATAQNESRPVLTGVLIEASGREVTMVAIDGVRLALRRAYLSRDGAPETKAILPARALNEVARLLQSADGELSIKIGEGHAAFAVGNVKVVSRLLEGQFPPYSQIIPKSYATTVTVKRQDFHDGCDRASVVSSDQDNTIHMHLAQERISITAASPEVGKVREEVDAHVEGEEVEIAFNARLIVEGLKVMESEEILLRSTGKASPACIRSVEHENFIYIVMPLRTTDVS